jgi:hypothetical protein
VCLWKGSLFAWGAHVPPTVTQDMKIFLFNKQKQTPQYISQDVHMVRDSREVGRLSVSPSWAKFTCGSCISNVLH